MLMQEGEGWIKTSSKHDEIIPAASDFKPSDPILFRRFGD
jgi:hypothetical protein